MEIHENVTSLHDRVHQTSEIAYNLRVMGREGEREERVRGERGREE